jgi:ABC-type branched-subunit amino acid transport system ATPase component
MSTSAAPSAQPLLSLDGVCVAYGGGAIEALRDVTLQVPDGKIVVLLGVNGAGKTSTLRTVAGLLGVHGGALTAGHVRFDGEDISGWNSWSIVGRGISMVMEGRRIFADLTVDENLRAGGFTVRDKKKYAQNYDRVMTLFPRLKDRRKLKGGLLSGGEQQMLAIGRALLQAPRLLLLDEPSLGLAPLVVERIKEIIVEINQQGTGVVLIEQNAAMALSIADYAYVLERRRVSREGTGAELLADRSIRDLYLGVGAEGRRSYRQPAATGLAEGFSR